MPLGPFGEILGTTGTLETLGPDVHKYKSHVVAPRNPKIVKQNEPDKHKHQKKHADKDLHRFMEFHDNRLNCTQLTPSKFLFEMSLSTEQKLANTHIMKIPRKIELLDMGDTSLQKFSKVNIDEPMFQPFPSEIYFQNFQPFHVYEVALVLRNNDKVPRLIKVTQENSPYFKIISPNDVGHKVGPGLPTTFRVQFMPDENKDYKHELICITEREKFVVPIRAIGARGILDFPDNIHFSSCFVKYPNTKTLLVRNIGSRDAKFCLKVKAPFSVSPDIGALGVNESMQVTVEYKPLVAGDHKGTLCLAYDTGEEIVIGLYGAAQDANIHLDENSIHIDNTYISMANQHTIVISNLSSIIAHFRWTRFATHDDEEQHRLLQQIELDREENSDTDKFLEECVTDPMLRDKLSILSRTFQNRKKAVENDALLFNDDIVSIEPLEGDVWPNSTHEVTIIFKPREATSYARTAYCDITGRENRLPLRIRGDGIGPKVDFSFEHLEMGNIFIGSKHTYEIVLANKGDIDAIYSVVPKDSIFGPCFAFNPPEGIIMPGGHQAIEVTFCSPYLGDFEEVFCFQVDGQPEQCAIKFSGRVVGPTFNFDVAKLKFGTVAYGFLSSQVCHLVNTSLVPMLFNLRVPGDGVNKSVSCTHSIQHNHLEAKLLPANDPKEFEVIPSNGLIQPQSQIKVTVNLIPNTIRKYEVALVVDVERVGEEIISLPISAKSVVPEISNAFPVINYGRCFLHHPYTHHINLHNDTELAAMYEIDVQHEHSCHDLSISYQSPQPKGIIHPHSVAEVPLTIQANALGEQEMVCFIRIFGNPSPFAVNLVCVGEGPVVHVNPHSIDWGEIPVLRDNERTLTLSNESFIPAKFKALVLRPNTVFRVSPSEGEIPPEKTVVLTVKVKLDDCVRFQDKLVINILESQTRHIPLQAVGKGTTIVSDPPLGPVLNLGPNFSNRLLRRKFQLTNEGRRIQQLIWLTDGYISQSKAKMGRSKANSIGSLKQKHSSLALEIPQPVFQLSPNRMELTPGESVDLTIEGFVHGPQSVSENIVCHAIIGRSGGKIPIINVTIRAEFIEPLLNFSTKCAFFRVDKTPNEEMKVVEKHLDMNNVSSLPLTVGLKLPYPFSLIIDGQKVNETTVCLQSGDVYNLVIQFDPNFKDDSYMRTIDEVLHISYKEHPHVDYIALRGEVYFPNLEFEKMAVDFGCILNDTEVTRYINITNISPIEVCYHWSFLVDTPSCIKRMPGMKQKAQAEIEEVNVSEELTFGTPTKQDENLNLEVPPGSDVEEEKQDVEKVEKIDHIHTTSADEDKTEQPIEDGNKNNQDQHILFIINEEAPEKGQLDQEEKLDHETEKFEERERKSSSFSNLSLLDDDEKLLKCNNVLAALLEDDDDDDDSVPFLGVEEVFDILPLFGCLQPGETEQVTFTFYGHANIWGEVCAVCQVQDGPAYQLTLTGEASFVEYSFSSKTIDYGKQMYEHVATSAITLINTGKVGFEFSAVNMDPALESRPLPGQPVMVPRTGYIKPFEEQKIEVRFLPGVPEYFQKTFQIQVAHFKPDTITISGEGVFPRVSLDLPRLDNETNAYTSLLKEAKENLTKMRREQQEKAMKADSLIKQNRTSMNEVDIMKIVSVDENSTGAEETVKAGISLLHEQVETEPTELELQMEIERLAVRDFVLQHQNEADYNLACHNCGDNHLQPNSSELTTVFSDLQTNIKMKPVLPAYLLDFGYVVLGTVRTHVIHATNTGWLPVSFRLDRQKIRHSGFHTELDRVKNLPGAPDNDTFDFVVTFDPRGANLHLGPVEVIVPISIVKGPVIKLCLRAHVTMPDMKVSDDVLEFGEVKCGQCKVVTVQLHNYQMVKCEWNSTPPDERKKMEKHVPMHLRRKMRQSKKQPNIFEVLPPTGSLLPGQKINVQVKFMPTEEKFYENRIQIRIAESSQRILLLCHGQGLEPRLDFESTLVQFDPILPHSMGDEQTMTVRNPCSFPIEFYSLEFDTNYLHEERVLRLMRGYDEYNTLLLPPRQVNEKLPHELLDYYDEQMKKVEEEEKARIEAQLEAEQKERSEKEAIEPPPLVVEKHSEIKQEEEKDKKKKKPEIKEQVLPKEEIIIISETAEAGEAEVTSNLSDTVVKSKSDYLTPIISSTTAKESSTEVLSPSAESVTLVPADNYFATLENLLEEKMKNYAAGLEVGELEVTPVSAAIARYLGIDLTYEGKAARNRRGIAIIVQGAPLSGKTSTAVALAKHYEAALLTIDGIVCDAIASGNTSAGLKARELCSQTARKYSEEAREQETHEGEKRTDGLSVEAVAAHTQAGMAGAKKTAIMPDQKSKVTTGGKNTTLTSSVDGSQLPFSPPPLTGPIARRLSISASVAGEDGFMSCVLPEEILVEILAERLQLNDCYQGVVFDGLETLFSQSYLTTATAILKALNNRRFIFFITLKLEYSVLKEQEEKAKKQKELEEQENNVKEIKWLEEMDEEEYDALPDDVRARVDQKLLELKKERMKRDKEKAEKDKLERETREEVERKKDEDRSKGKVKKRKSSTIQEPKDKEKKSLASGKSQGAESSKKGQAGTKGQEGEKEHLETGGAEKPHTQGETDKKKEKKGKKEGKHAEVVPAVEDQKDPAREAEIFLMQRFRNFEAAQKDIQDLLDMWDRSILQTRAPVTPSERSDEDQKESLISAKKGKARDKIDKEKMKEIERLRQEKEIMEKSSKGTCEDRDLTATEPDKKDDIGVPNIIVDCANKTFLQPVQMSKTEVLPNANESYANSDVKSANKNKSANRSFDRKSKNLNLNNITAPIVTTRNKLLEDMDNSLVPFKNEEEVPNLFTDMTLAEMILISGKLPSVNIVLDGLGLGPQGPPIPPPVTFSVVPYPVKRRPPPVSETGGQYLFVASSPDDSNIGLEQKESEYDGKEEDKSKGARVSERGGRISSENKLDHKRSAERKKTGRRNSSQAQSPLPGQSTPMNDLESQSGDRDQTEIEDKVPAKKLTVFRWTVPACDSITLRLRFTSTSLGQYDQTLNFEIVGTRRRYQIFCRGVCAFPTISKEPRIVFPSRKKKRSMKEIVHKKYILATEIFDFGPLLVGKSRERYREGKYPENMEHFTILNTSPMEADVSFCYLHDSNGETFLLEPPSMILKPGESSMLTVWAYPRGPGHYEDAVVCCMRENPEPIVFKVCCDAFRPELELDKKVLQFDRVLLHRKDTKTIFLQNSTQLPVAWKLSGLENLGDDFTVAADSGIVEPLSEYPLHAYFRAMKASQPSKKMIRIEISDADNILGVVHTEPIQVIAEAYDVALDMSFPKDLRPTKKNEKAKKGSSPDEKKGRKGRGSPRMTPPGFSLADNKGTDGGLDFGIIKVNEDAKQICTLKNKGRYEIAFHFLLENVGSKKTDLASFFSVFPSSGKLNPTDKPTQVTVAFKTSREIAIKDLPILKCQVIEPSLGEKGETIASIPVRLSVKAVFSKFSITPSQDINFGALLVGTKKTRTFTIENKGEFDFKYLIFKKNKESSQSVLPSHLRQSKPDSNSGQAKLTLGMFTIFPTFGIILPKGNQVVSVDCFGEVPGKDLQDICIDFTDRDPASFREGVPYQFMAEACIPGINVDDIGSIFEEHRVCKNLSVWQHMNCDQSEVGGIYGEDEKKFVFNNVIVGRQAKARFKISNTNKVPCDVALTLKPKGAPKSQDAFDLDPPHMQIPNNSYMYATVTFTPQSMQYYSAMFEASIEGLTQNQARGKSLTFEVSGEGNLPRITITKPAVRNKRGQPLLLFRCILIGRSESLPLELLNEGTLASKVDIDILDPDGCFKLRPTKQTRAATVEIVDDSELKTRPHAASVVVNPNENATFEVIYQPTSSQRSQANLKVTVVDNQYEDYIIQMLGEGYEDDITLDNIGSVFAPIDPETELISMEDDDVPAAQPNLMQFGDCYISENRTLNFTMTNHSKTDCIKFQWPEHQHFKFSPKVGHLHARCSKDVAVTFNSDNPVAYNKFPLLCLVTKITFDRPISQICDWDDKLQVVKWVDAVSPIVISDDSGSSTNRETLSRLPTKKKVVEVEAEPEFTEVPDSARNVELLTSAISDYAECSCHVTSIHFKDTLMFQTRIYRITLENVGRVALNYSWKVSVDNCSLSRPYSANVTPKTGRSESQMDTADTSYLPFLVDPECGTIPAGKTAHCIVKFAPLDANDYEGKLICRIPHLSMYDQYPVITLRGCSIVPHCHFELEDSDYISSARRNPELRGPRGAPPGSALDPNTRVLEFNVCGIGVKLLKEFGIVNPTNKPYNFEWICEDEGHTKQPPPFHCLHKDGEIRSGRKFKVGFEFRSHELDIVESFWRFVIPSESISLPFLLVGNTREPIVCFDRSHLNFKFLLIGQEVKETVYLVNNEDNWFSFTFDENSCHSEGYISHLRVEPMQGQVSAKSSVPINLYYSPSSEKEVNFNLRCMVARKPTPLTLNVKAQGYSMNSILICEDPSGNRVELTGKGPHLINFGEVEVNETAIRHLLILNSGKFSFDYIWEMNEAQVGAKAISMTPRKGSVAHGETERCSLMFCPYKRMSVKDYELQLKVVNGQTYQISVVGLGVIPGLHFSFLTYSFGNCFILKPGLDLPPKQTVLRIKNKDKKEIGLDCLYEPTSHLSYKFRACVLAPNKEINIPFTFCPRQAIKYHETVTFQINGLSDQKVEFFGNGSEMKIEVVDPKHKCINLRARMVGDNVKKFIPIVNNSPVSITFKLAFTPSEPMLQNMDVMSINPREPITLAANGGTAKVEVWFRPKARIPQFTEEVLIECAGMFQPVFVIKGSCLGMEVTLDSDAISFGTVFQQSSSSRKLVMSNTGDMNTKFRWDIKRFKPDFSIYPIEGYITPGMDVTFQVDFHPQTISADVRYNKLECFLDGGPHKPVYLTLTGSCTGIPPVKEVQTFQAVVRQSDTKQITIPNKSNQLWNLKPIIDGEYWTGPLSFTVEPQQTKAYELTYKPLTMTLENKKHVGSIYFPLPDGSGLLFNLSGTADAPRAAGKIQRDVPCKTSHTEILSIANWLKKPQRFRVKIESLKDKFDPGTTVKGVEYIDVPADRKNDYKLSFYAYKEGTTAVKVTFTNELTGEYQFFEVTFRATRPSTIATIELSTPVRQSALHVVSIENPLSNQVNFQISCSVAEVLIPSQFSVPANSQGQFSFEYQPLKVGVVTGRLELNSSDLGLYSYDLVLTATPGASEKAVYFRTSLGSSIAQVAKFLNFCKQKTDYICKVDNKDFHVDKSVPAAPASPGGTEVTLDVMFEPSVLGEQRTMLLLSSSVGGEYTIPLFGTCEPPKPQGPFTVKAGSNIPIIFKNVFSTPTHFTFQVDNPLFHLTKQSESIRPHKEHRIVVSFDGSDVRSKAAVMGKLIVSCAHTAGGSSNVQWMYYLKGIPH